MQKRSLINGIDFGPIWAMSGLLNFYGQGWPYHKVLKGLGVSFDKVTLVSKTTTLLARDGNLPLKANLMPKELIPKSIHINWRHRCALNTISLSGPGAEVIVSTPQLQLCMEPIQLSFMSVAATREERVSELMQFIQIVLRNQTMYQSRFAVQLNITCPNTGHELASIEEVSEMLSKCGKLISRGIPVIPKISVEMPLSFLIKIGHHPNCSALCTTNTVKFDNMPDRINWKKLYPHGSPLLKRNLPISQPGGLSGAPLLPLMIEQIKDLRKSGFAKHINGGGGILSASDAVAVFEAGADSISIGSIAFLAPFNINSVIKIAHHGYDIVPPRHP